jgi:crotonobetainyl-CoA:carnitine CoA-transferase CaiB-like acyl-CoA transferase
MTEASPNVRSDGAAEPALKGVCIVDFTHYIAGPLATMILADLGADVIKIESPGRGDEQRHFPPVDKRLGGEGPSFLWANRNKRSVVVDLKSERGLAIARKLIAQADIVVENFSFGVMKKLGLDYESLAADHPRLIYCVVSAYERTGDFATRTGFDVVLQAESGFMSVNGFPDREPVRSGPAIMDISTGMMASNAMLAALNA